MCSLWRKKKKAKWKSLPDTPTPMIINGPPLRVMEFHFLTANSFINDAWQIHEQNAIKCNMFIDLIDFLLDMHCWICKQLCVIIFRVGGTDWSKKNFTFPFMQICTLAQFSFLNVYRATCSGMYLCLRLRGIGLFLDWSGYKDFTGLLDSCGFVWEWRKTWLKRFLFRKWVDSFSNQHETAWNSLNQLTWQIEDFLQSNYLCTYKSHPFGKHFGIQSASKTRYSYA